MTDIELHPEAVKSFNRKATQLLENISDCSRVTTGRQRWTPEIPSQKIEEISDARYGAVDHNGREIAKYFVFGKKLLGLKDEGYNSFLKLAQTIQKNREFTNIFSLGCVKNSLFDWITLKHQELITQEFIPFFLENCLCLIEEHEIWIPVSMVFIESKLKIGKIELTPISIQIINKWHEKALELKINSSEAINKIKTENAACVAGVMKIKAERDRAYEIAVKETEFALRILRVFSPGAILPDKNSYCIILASINMGFTRIISIKGGTIAYMEEQMLPHGIPEWEIDNNLVHTIKTTGLDILNQVFENKQKTDFQKTVITSLELYSKCCIARDLAEKLIYIFSALESVFLKNSNEAIQQNVSERIAFFEGGTVEEKKEIISNFKKVYSLRSSFVHHGYEIELIEELENFMKRVWCIFMKLIKNINKFESKELFIQSIEDRKLV
jgi:hypothetical protein